jgi:branched-chain amino acid aminotransferase
LSWKNYPWTNTPTDEESIFILGEFIRGRIGARNGQKTNCRHQIMLSTSQLFTYLNGRFLPEREAVMSLDDRGFVWGATATDRLRTFRQKLFRLDDHLRRFRQSCERAFITQPRSDAELANIARELTEMSAKRLGADAELSLVIFATPGPEGGEPTLGMQAQPLALARYAPLFRDGARLHAVTCAQPVEPGIKHRSRLAWWIAKQRLSPGIEPLFTTDDPDRFIRETPSANFLAVIEQKLVSPPRGQVLDGISLHVVLELAVALDIPFVERELSLAETAAATECLITNSSFCMAPVASITSSEPSGDSRLSPIFDRARMAGNVPASIFTRLLDAWSDLVGIDIPLQFASKR